MKNYINLWQNENNRYIYKDKQYKVSLIEMLVSLEIPAELSTNKPVRVLAVPK